MLLAQFIESYSLHAAPLNLLTRKNTPFIWGSEQKQAFHNLRDALSAHPCLGTIRRHGQLVVDTDACDVAIGSVLHQIQEGTERVIGYYSKLQIVLREKGAQPRKSCWPLWPRSIIEMCTGAICLKNDTLSRRRFGEVRLRSLPQLQRLGTLCRRR